MRKILLLVFVANLSFAFSLSKLISAYKSGNHRYVCIEGAKNFSKIKKDADLITMYAFSCLNIDKIDRLSVPIIFLKNSPEQRKNRAYFSLIIAQKNILVNALFDGQEFSGLNVPNSDYVLSRVFNLYFQKKYKFTDNRYNMEDERGKYTLYTDSKKGRKIMVIEEIDKDGKKIIHHYR